MTARPDRTPAIETRSLGKRFGGRWAVQEVDLRIEAGSIFGFLGLNGAGKTTAIRLVLGLLRPTSGSALIFGHDVARDRLAAARQVGALLDARAVYPALTGVENLDMARRLLGLPSSEIGRVLEIVDLAADARRKVEHYSLGMRQRLGLARALLGSPGLLILDEPMNGLDPAGIRDMRRVIRQMPERCGAAVFLSSHLLSEVAQTVDQVGLMHEGRLVRQGPIREVMGGEADLLVRTDRNGAALDLLRRAHFRPRPDGDHHLLLPEVEEAGAGRINRLLVTEGFEVIELYRRPPTLEHLFAPSVAERLEVAA